MMALKQMVLCTCYEIGKICNAMYPPLYHDYYYCIKVSIDQPHDPAIPRLRCVHVCVAASFIVDKRWKQPQDSSETNG